METIKESRNELFKRKEIDFLVETDKNPSFVEMKKQISETIKKPEDTIVVNNIRGSFGKKTFLINSYIYDSKELLEKAIQKTKKQINEEKKAKEEKRKAEMEVKKKPETPAENA